MNFGRASATATGCAAFTAPTGVAVPNCRWCFWLILNLIGSTADFERVRKLIYQHAGISLSPVKQDMVYSRLARRLRATGKPSFAAYLDALEKITASAFGQRRKMLRAALKSLPGAVEALEASGIDPTRRAETLTQAEFRKLTALWREAR